MRSCSALPSVGTSSKAACSVGSHAVSVVQERSLVAVGGTLSYSPGWHSVNNSQMRSLVAVGAALSYSPVSQGGLIAAQTRSLVSVAGVLSYSPAPQLPNKGAHSRSLVAVGATVSYSSSPHSVSAAQSRSLVAEGALRSYSPSPQSEMVAQTRSVVAVGATLSYSSSPHSDTARNREQPHSLRWAALRFLYLARCPRLAPSLDSIPDRNRRSLRPRSRRPAPRTRGEGCWLALGYAPPPYSHETVVRRRRRPSWVDFHSAERASC